MSMSNGTAWSSPTTARMSSVDPSSDVPIACIRNRTRSCCRRRRWISAMYSDALASGRPSASTVKSAVAIRRAYLGQRRVGDPTHYSDDGPNDVGIELGAGVVHQLTQRDLLRHRHPVRPLAGHRVEGIATGDDPGGER